MVFISNASCLRWRPSQAIETFKILASRLRSDGERPPRRAQTVRPRAGTRSQSGRKPVYSRRSPRLGRRAGAFSMNNISQKYNLIKNYHLLGMNIVHLKCQNAHIENRARWGYIKDQTCAIITTGMLEFLILHLSNDLYTLTISS